MRVRISTEHLLKWLWPCPYIPSRVGSGAPQNGSLWNFMLHNIRKLVEVCQFSLGRTIFMIILHEHLPAFLRWVLASPLCVCAVFITFCARMEARKWKLDFVSFNFQMYIKKGTLVLLIDFVLAVSCQQDYSRLHLELNICCTNASICREVNIP